MTPAPSTPPASDLAKSRRLISQPPTGFWTAGSETELQSDAGHPWRKNVVDPAERSAQIRDGDRRAAVDQVEHREAHIHGRPARGSELLGYPEAGDRHDGTLLRSKLLHAQRDRALEQARVGECLSSL